MNLVKSKNVGDSLENLRREDGSEFGNPENLKNYIGDYYKGIYKQENNAAKITSLENIYQFLGPVATNPIVVNSKLTNDERDELEVDISEQELTQSINNANLSSSPGADGISNRFIKHFWQFFKTPLLKLCRHCYETNSLPVSFKSANIKLIPKKGDVSKIKNWRPISLLNCFYKIVSRVITARLRKFMDKMTPICQKGYSSNRYCQEVLINVMENIERLKRLNKKGCLISLDIKKAFDSLSHSYLNSVYKFYNMGPRIIKWITLLCTNRQACVIIDGTFTTEYFDLERGNAQGDTISPFLFNLGYQILLFKLELCLQIEGLLVETAREVQRDLDQVLQGPDPQVRVSDPKAFALADDCSLLVKMETANLQNIITILSDFEAKITNTGVCYEDNVSIILEKIRKQSNFWKRYSLSLPGRINVAKTFLYSQINYLGCFLPMSKQEIKTISLEIEKFVCGKLRIAKNRIFQKKCEGGLELIDLEDYIGSQCCSWVRRAVDLNDLWKKEMFTKSYNSLFNVRQKNYDCLKNPILHYIAGYFEKFIYKFTATNENFRESFVYDNPCLTFDVNRPHYMKKTFFSDVEWAMYKNQILTLTVDKIINGNIPKSKQEFENTTGIILSDIKFNKIRGLANSSLQKFTKNNHLEKKIDNVKNFLMRVKKGSKRIRKILTGTHTCVVSPNILKFAELTECIIDAENSSRLNSSWGYSFLHNSTKTFLFKLHNNILGLNSRVAHFVRDHSSTCTFCDITFEPEENVETTKHLFFECRHVDNLLTAFYTWIFNAETPRFVSRREFFVGFNLECDFKNKTLNIISHLVKKFIWECKTRFSIPTIECAKKSVISDLELITKLSPKTKRIFNATDLFNNIDIRFLKKIVSDTANGIGGCFVFRIHPLVSCKSEKR